MTIFRIVILNYYYLRIKRFMVLFFVFFLTCVFLPYVLFCQDYIKNFPEINVEIYLKKLFVTNQQEDGDDQLYFKTHYTGTYKRVPPEGYFEVDDDDNNEISLKLLRAINFQNEEKETINIIVMEEDGGVPLIPDDDDLLGSILFTIQYRYGYLIVTWPDQDNEFVTLIEVEDQDFPSEALFNLKKVGDYEYKIRLIIR